MPGPPQVIADRAAIGHLRPPFIGGNRETHASPRRPARNYFRSANWGEFGNAAADPIIGAGLLRLQHHSRRCARVRDTITADHGEIGKVQARIQKYDQAIGIVAQLNRLSSSVECNGVCYFPSSSKPIAWKCDPGRKCELRCTVSPPVGGCN